MRVASDTPEPDWHREVSLRLQQYRARRGRLRADDSQSGLPFAAACLDEGRVADVEDETRVHRHVQYHGAVAAAAVPVRRESPARRPTANRAERLEIRVQPRLDFSAAADDRARPQNALVPVATLPDRRLAGALDALFLGLTCAGFAGLFRSLGGEFAFEKMDAIVCAAVVFLFYALYMSLFITLAGATPGMQLRGLTIVRLDGNLPDTRQLLWRSFGYTLSAATLFLGFLWALWDDDLFTWHDRISHTYVTSAPPLSHFDTMSFGVRPH